MSREESVHGRLRFVHEQMTENARGEKSRSRTAETTDPGKG